MMVQPVEPKATRAESFPIEVNGNWHKLDDGGDGGGGEGGGEEEEEEKTEEIEKRKSFTLYMTQSASRIQGANDGAASNF